MTVARARVLLLLVAAAFAVPSSAELAEHVSSEWRRVRDRGGKNRGKRHGGKGKGIDLVGLAGGRHQRGRMLLCDDSCKTARNGRCEDGSNLLRRPSNAMVKLACDLGTDCADCGPVGAPLAPATLREAMPSAPALDEPRLPLRPIAQLTERHIQVNLAWTRTQPPFLMPFTNPAEDVDVSRMMASSARTVEPLYNVYWHRLCAACCAKGGLMLDVGANFGYYSFLAAKMGCRVVAWEPVPAFRSFVAAALRLNNLTHRVHLRPAVVSDVPGVPINMTVPLKGIWGTASVGGLNVDPSIRSPTYQVRSVSETLDQVVTETPCIMKLDVEGYEPSVLKGARRFLAEHAPAAILTEYTPGVMERQRNWRRLPEYPASLRQFSDAGYAIWHLFGTSKGSAHILEQSWASLELPPLAEVTRRSLDAEETNARNMLSDNTEGRFGFSIPWDLHPRSLHAEFSHNTDLLLTLDHGAIRRRREVGVSGTTRFGLGGGFCEHVLRDGTAAEMVGRLCLPEGRNESIAKAIGIAELPRPLRNRQSWHAFVARVAREWSIEGKSGSRKRQMRRKAAAAARVAGPAAGPGWRARGRGRAGRLP